VKVVGEHAKRARLTVRLVYDSQRLQESFGRRCAPGEDRSLLFRAGPFSLDLLVYGTLEGIHGQLCDEEGRRPVVGATAILGPHKAKTDAHGQFSLPPGGASLLRVYVKGGEIAFPLPARGMAVAV